MAKILIAESEIACYTQRKIMLEQAGHEVLQFSDIDEMSQWSVNEDICGVILSEHFSVGDPADLIEKVKTKFLAPILVYTDFKDEDVHSALLESGADDVITTSATPRLWQARLNALLRQYSQEKAAVLTFGNLVVDSLSRLVKLNSKEIYLTTHEFELLWLLARNAGKVLSREYVYQTILEKPYQDDTRTIDVRISRLRKKLEDDPSQPSKIKTVWKQGYIFVKEAWG